MGIQGLLRFVKDATTEIHIRQYAGRCVAVDTYCWLHRGAFACADKLAKGEKTDQYIKYCMKFVGMLESYNVRPILVFDGCHLPSKIEVEKQRRERRELYMQKGKQFLREGRTNDARDAFTKCISVTPHMALAVMEAARERGVDCLVAPYEADAQLAFLLKQGYAQAVVTEDSDLVCFGCQTVILKMDLTGRAQELSLDRLEMVKSLSGFTLDSFRHMCILSGCDYLPNIKGIGLAKACKAVKLAKNKDIHQTVRKLHQYIKGIAPVEPEYVLGFERADNTFLYQLVFDPKTRKLVPLNAYPEGVTQKDVEYAGPQMVDEQALQIAWGNTHVGTGMRFGNFDADKWLESQRRSGKNKVQRCSIWAGDFFKHSTTSSEKLKSMKDSGKKPALLRGQEVVVNSKIFKHAIKQNKPDEIHIKEKAFLNKQNIFVAETIADSDLINAYKCSAKKALPEEQTLRQRMRLSRKMPTISSQLSVVKSRFFHSKNHGDSFVEEIIGGDATDIGDNSSSNMNTLNNSKLDCMTADDCSTDVGETTSSTADETHVDETPDQTVLANSSLDGDQHLDTILEELAAHVTITPISTADVILNPSTFNQTKSLRKSLHQFQRTETSKPPKTEIIGERTAGCSAKRKNPFKTEDSGSTGADCKQRTVCKTTRRFDIHKRKIAKPIPHPANHDADNMLHDVCSPGVDYQSKISRRISGEAIRQSAHCDPERKCEPFFDISKKVLHLDDISREGTSSNHKQSTVRKLEISIDCVIPRPGSKFVADKGSSVNGSCSLLSEHSCNGLELERNSPKGAGSVLKLEPIVCKVQDPVVLSSDEENIPYIDDVREMVPKRQKTLGSSQRISPTSFKSVKSKYFGAAKASGLKKNKSEKRKKAKYTEPANQIKITSLFSKLVSEKK